MNYIISLCTLWYLSTLNVQASDFEKPSKEDIEKQVGEALGVKDFNIDTKEYEKVSEEKIPIPFTMEKRTRVKPELIQYFKLNYYIKNPHANTDISKYKGDKLLLCAGHKTRGSYNADDNKDWYTVDLEPDFDPDYIADLTKDQTYKYLGEDKFDIIIDEACIRQAEPYIVKNAAPMLKKGGVLYSYTYSPQEDVLSLLKSSGFSEIIFTGLDPIKSKKLSKEELIEMARKTDPNPNGPVQYFAIK